MSTPRTVRLSPNDNVVVAVDPIAGMMNPSTPQQALQPPLEVGIVEAVVPQFVQ